VLAVAGGAARRGSGLFVSDWLSVVGVIVTAVGLGLAIWQIRKTRTATEATQRSVSQTLGRLARDEMLSLVAALQRVDRDLQRSVSEGQPAIQVGDRLADWRDYAYGLWELVHRDEKLQALLDDLLESAKLAAELRGKLPEEVEKMPSATKAMRASTSRVCGHLATLGQRLRFDLERTDDASTR
jgi:hypothetical protein